MWHGGETVRGGGGIKLLKGVMAAGEVLREKKQAVYRDVMSTVYLLQLGF